MSPTTPPDPGQRHLTAAPVGFLFGVVTLLANSGIANLYLMGGRARVG